jgi:transcriptional regulator with XRE-family HTH domain
MSMNTTLRKRFGDRVRELRQAIGLSQEAFADHCGFARSYMSRIERGKGNPSLDAIETLAVVLRVETYELFTTDKPGSGKPVQAKPTKGKTATRAGKRPAVKAKSKMEVPYAKDGTCFHPGLTKPRTGRYYVGAKGAVKTFADFDEALAYLRKMKPAYWSRPNASGNWGVVVAKGWGELKE